MATDAVSHPQLNTKYKFLLSFEVADEIVTDSLELNSGLTCEIELDIQLPRLSPSS